MTKLCAWCVPARILNPDRTTGAIWLGKGPRTDGICAACRVVFLAEVEAA